MARGSFPKLIWKRLRTTKGGRTVSETVAVPWTNAKSGVSRWTVRNRVREKVSTLRPDRCSYIFLVDFEFQFPGKKKITGTLEHVPDPRTLKSRMKPEQFLGTMGFRKKLNEGTWRIYRHVVRSLMLGNRGQLPAYAKSVGRKKGYRRYRLFRLRLRIERTCRYPKKDKS